MPFLATKDLANELSGKTCTNNLTISSSSRAFSAGSLTLPTDSNTLPTNSVGGALRKDSLIVSSLAPCTESLSTLGFFLSQLLEPSLPC